MKKVLVLGYWKSKIAVLIPYNTEHPWIIFLTMAEEVTKSNREG